MQKEKLLKRISVIFCVVLMAVIALVAVGCNGNQIKEQPKVENSGKADSSSNLNNDALKDENASKDDSKVMGEGSTRFYLEVVDKAGNIERFEINTDKETVGDALLELEIISGDKGAYGLYIKYVNGIRADYDKDGTYWAFYIDGEYAMSGVDTTKVEAGKTYSLKIEG